MRTMLGTIAGLAGGLVTSLICAAICLALQRYLEFSFFTLMVWFIIPAGAAITGIASSSGFYAGAKLFDARANAVMALGMVAIAGLTQFLIYFGTYATLQLPDGRTAMDVVDFWTFVKIYLGNQRYSMGHGGGFGVDVGNLGYVIAGVQPLEFLAGGACTFLVLQKEAFCEKCGRYFRRRFAVSKQGSAAFIDAVRAKLTPSPDYFGALQQPEGAGFRLNVSLSQCPECSQELVSEEVEFMEKKQWKALPKLSRRLSPEEPVLSMFQSLPDAKKVAFGRFRS